MNRFTEEILNGKLHFLYIVLDVAYPKSKRFELKPVPVIISPKDYHVLANITVNPIGFDMIFTIINTETYKKQKSKNIV